MHKVKEKLAFKNYYIKKMHVNDVCEDYLQWINDPEVNEFLESKYTLWTMESLREYVKSFENTKGGFLFTINCIDSDKYIGNGSISSVNYNTETFSFALFIGDVDFWGKNAAFETSMLLLKFGFEELNMRKFFGGAYSNQLASRFVLKRIGMVQEAKLKDKFKYKDRYVDQVIYSLHKDAWLTVKEKYKLT
jgi:ribosomal-protein-alanine N-acetyltransferase